MKKQSHSIKIILLLLIVLASCSKDFLDTKPPYLTDESFFSDDEHATMVLAGAYDPMAWYNFYQLTEWAIGDVVSDDAEKGGGGDGDYAEIYDMEHFQVNSENPLISQRWDDCYVGINRANKLIEGVTDNDNISSEAQTRLIAEARFLRGFYHFYLVKTFGGVPIVDHILSPSEYTNPRNTIEECYTFIETDFKAAIQGLPKKSQIPSDEIGRATWGAAKAFLCKTYMFEEKWQKAYDTATEIINSGEYDLDADYAHLFTIDADNGVESVFDVQYKDLNMPGWLDENEGCHLEVIMRSRDDRNEGWGFNQPTQNLYEEFESGDPRRDATFVENGETLWTGTADEETFYTVQDPVHNPDSYTPYNNQKRALPASQRGNGEDQAGMNVHVIRFAEVLLWQAEAAAHLGLDWQTPINSVRTRAGLANTNYSNGLDAVYHERRVELAMEGHRYWDLVRTGRGNLMQGYNDNKRYFPIPQAQINLNPNLTQNPY